jgi:succinylglutamate desuccinylase
MSDPLPPRLIGQIDGPTTGPTMVVFGAVHGNETAGVDAIRRVFKQLESRHRQPLGTVLGLVGNRRAMAAGRRFLGRDLNRAWTRAHLEHGLDDASVSENLEQAELLEVLGPHLRAAERPLVLLDLHSTSGDGIPFALAGDVLRNRPLAFALGLPVVLGLDEVVEGAMLSHFCDLGHIGVAIEGGRQGDPRTVDQLESAIWTTMVAAGVLQERAVPDLPIHQERLRETTDGTPQLMEVAYRHVVTPQDDYEMQPGYRSFQPIRRGELVGRDVRGPVRAPHGGLMLLPRYQSEGEDGFFIARPVTRTWLRASAAVRRLGLDRLLESLPGIEPADDQEHALVVKGAAARLISQGVFHLFGYRRSRTTTDGRLVMRRRPDHVGLHPSAEPE